MKKRLNVLALLLCIAVFSSFLGTGAIAATKSAKILVPSKSHEYTFDETMTKGEFAGAFFRTSSSEGKIAKKECLLVDTDETLPIIIFVRRSGPFKVAVKITDEAGNISYIGANGEIFTSKSSIRPISIS